MCVKKSAYGSFYLKMQNKHYKLLLFKFNLLRHFIA